MSNYYSELRARNIHYTQNTKPSHAGTPSWRPSAACSKTTSWRSCAMSDPSPIYKNPLSWWQDHLAKLEQIEQYMAEQQIPMTAADRAMIGTARSFVTRYVIDKLESSNGDEGTA